MQLSFVLDRPPVGFPCCMQDLYRCFHFFVRRREGSDDRLDLAWMDAPHAGIAELIPRACGIAGNHTRITNLGRDTVRWHLAMGMAGSRDFQLGAGYQRM